MKKRERENFKKKKILKKRINTLLSKKRKEFTFKVSPINPMESHFSQP